MQDDQKEVKFILINYVDNVAPRSEPKRTKTRHPLQMPRNYSNKSTPHYVNDAKTVQKIKYASKYLL